MNKIKILLMLLVVASCGRLVTKLAVAVNKEARPAYLSNGSRTLVYIPMMHINKPKYYEGVKREVDSLRNEGYVIFYENVKMSSAPDSAAVDIIQRKFRKITGFHLSTYLDTINKSVANFQIEGVVHQGFENTGVNPKTDIRADIPLDTLIYLYERERGEIVLTECDRRTGLNEKYKCGKGSKEDQDFLLQYLRNRHLFNEVVHSKHNKIAVVYGKLHMYPLIKNLQANDSTWVYIHPHIKN